VTQLDELLALQRANEQRITDLERELSELRKLLPNRLTSSETLYGVLVAEIRAWFAQAMALNPAYAEARGVDFGRRFNRRILAAGRPDAVWERLATDGVCVRLVCHDRTTLVVEGSYYGALSTEEQAALALPAETRKALKASHAYEPPAENVSTGLDSLREARYNELKARGLPDIEAWEQAHAETFDQPTSVTVKEPS